MQCSTTPCNATCTRNCTHDTPKRRRFDGQLEIAALWRAHKMSEIADKLYKVREWFLAQIGTHYINSLTPWNFGYDDESREGEKEISNELKMSKRSFALAQSISIVRDCNSVLDFFYTTKERLIY